MGEQESKLITDQLDTLKKLVRNTCEEYETKQASLILIDTGIKKAQVDIKNVAGGRKFKKFFKAYNAVLDDVFKACRENAEAMDTKGVPITVFESFIDNAIEGFAPKLEVAK